MEFLCETLFSSQTELDHKELKCTFQLSNEIMKVLSELAIPFIVDGDNIIVEGTNCVDMLGRICKVNEQPLSLILDSPPTCAVYKTDDMAVMPSKTNVSDVGYDLTIIKEHKRISKKIILYDTGIKITMPFGYYAEIVPRSSLMKTGWMLANSVGIIDNSYTGNLMVSLINVDDTFPEISLPFRGFQLIVRKQYHVCMEEIASHTNVTLRGEGGFGSTN